MKSRRFEGVGEYERMLLVLCPFSRGVSAGECGGGLR
jgi:hypothetical protein